MSETPPTAPPTSTSPPLPPYPDVENPRRWLPSLVWLIPLLAALIGIGLIARSVLDKGPTVTVAFRTGDGMEQGKTKVKYKDVDIGIVSRIQLDDDLSKVQVTIAMTKEAKRFTATDTRFWVVRPKVGTGGVSGLGTLLSGAYIGVDAGKSEDTTDQFTGLETPPPITGDQQGRMFTLRGDSLGSIDVGSPVFYRRVQVGQVIAFGLDKASRGISMTVFINQPYVQYVSQNARWWHASGIDVRLDSNGFKLNTQSLAALVVGGIAFESLNGQKPDGVAPTGTSFVLASDQAAAMREPDGEPSSTVFYFDQSLRGLSPGAPVDFRGIVLGEVSSVGVEYDPVKKSLRMPVRVDLYPGRLGKRFETSLGGSKNIERKDVVVRMVQRGLRAQLRNGNLLTGQLYVALDFFPNLPKVTLNPNQQTLEIPTVPNSLDELQAQISSIARKLDKMPLAEIGNNLNASLQTANQLFKKLDTQIVPEMQDTLGAAKQSFSTAEKALQSDSPLQSDVRQALQQLTQTLQTVNALADYLERHPESLIRGKKGDKP